MKVEKIDHVCMLVRNMEKARKFFSELFETEFIELGEIQETDARSVIDPLGLEIIEPLKQDGVTVKTLEKRGEGLSLISFKVTKLDEAMSEMEERGIRLIGRMERGQMRAAIYHPKDTYGYCFVVFEQRPSNPMDPSFLVSTVESNAPFCDRYKPMAEIPP